MNETQRIHKLFEDLYKGDPWLDVTLAGTLSKISAAKAAQKPGPEWNSIWEITNHLICWRENVLKRVKGNVIATPGNNYFSYIIDTSEIAWQQTQRKLYDSQEAWTAFLSEQNPEDLNKIYPANNHTYADHIHGIIQHDAYHLGQIVMLAKHL